MEAVMSKLKKTVLTLTALAVALAAVHVATDQTLVAQIRAALVRDVDHPARQAVMIKHYTAESDFDIIYTVPAGKRLVVEHVNCTALDDTVYVGLYHPNALTHSNIVYSPPLISTSVGVTILDGDTRLYFEPGVSLSLRVFTSEPTTCMISGHTVDAN